MSLQSVIGPVPEHWAVRPFFATGRAVQTKNIGMRENNLLSLSYGRIVEKDIDSSEGLLPESFETYQIVQPNDMVFRFTDLQNDQRSLRSALVRTSGIITSAYLAFRPDANVIVPRFLDYLMRSYDLSKVFYPLGGGVRQSLKFDDVKRLGIIVPPLDEQKAIADFLDRELAQIDALIEKQELFEIVSQQRINSSVLTSITGNGALFLDPSSSEIWRGELPLGWSVRKLSHLFGSIGSGTTPTSDSDEYYGGTIPWVTTGELRETTILETSRYVTGKAMKDFSALKLHPKGSLVIAMYGATVGRLGFLGMDATVNQACCVMSKPLDLDIEYVYYALQGLREILVSLATGGGQPNISQGLLKSFMIPVPPRKEQIEIRERLEIEMKQHHDLRETNSQILKTLRDRRQSLISAAVTGKIDVRKVS